MLSSMARFHSLFYCKIVFHCVYILHFFTHSCVNRSLGYFHVLAIVNNAARNIQGILFFFFKLVYVCVFFPLEQLKSGFAEPYDGFVFNFLRNLHIVFHSSCISLHSQQTRIRVPISPHAHQHIIYCFFDNTHSDRCEVIFHCIWSAFPWLLVMLSIFSCAC